MIFIQKKKIFIIGITLLVALALTFYLRETSKPPVLKEKENALEDTEIDEQQEEDINEDAEDEEESDQEEETSDLFRERITDVLSDAFRFLKKDIHVLGIGDSLTQGVGDDDDQGGYIRILEETVRTDENNVTFENLGKRGNRTDQLLERLDDAQIASSVRKADIILVTIGANDIMQVVKENFTDLTFEDFLNEEEDFKNNLQEIIERMRELNGDAPIYLVGLYNPFERYFDDIEELDAIVDNWNQTSKNMTEEYEDVTFIPIKDLFDVTEVNLLAEDHFHPNKVGYHRMAKRVLEYLTEEGD